MGIFDKFKKKESNISIEQLKNEQYEQEYFETCKFIWKNYVPKSGQSTVLQGELLRELEKLRLEAQDNELDDAIGKLQTQHPDPIPFEKNSEIKR